MNETEKRALKILGQKKTHQIIGELKESANLNNEQCENLRNAVSNLSETEQLQIASGTGTPKKIDVTKLSTTPILIGYGAPAIHPILVSPTIMPKHHKILSQNETNDKIENKTEAESIESPL